MGEVIGAILAGIFRFIVEVIIHGIGEMAVHFPGYFLLKKLNGENYQPSDVASITVSIVLWLAFFLLGYEIYSLLQPGDG